MARIRLAELYLTLRKPELARPELLHVLTVPVEERGPRYEAACRNRARDVAKRLPASLQITTEEQAT
jgi:hypothetical protein